MRQGPQDEQHALLEAARLRYELARLHDRRTVRAALAVGTWRRLHAADAGVRTGASGLAGAAAAWEAMRGRAPRMDVPGPSQVPMRAPFPHLRVLHTGRGALLASTCAHERITAADAPALLSRDRPDLVLVDGVVGWTSAALAGVRELASRSGAAVVTVGPNAAAALPDADLRVSMGCAVEGSHLDLGVTVDVRRWSPAGLDDAGPAHRRDDAASMTPTDARRQPVVVVPEVAAVGAQRCVELLAAGALVVAGPDEGLARALGVLDTEVVGPAVTLDERAAALLADDDRRRRTSVRLRRHVHRRLATREALITLVERLGLDDRPSERISVLLATRRPERLRQATADIAAQRHDDVELILLPHGEVPLPEGLPGLARVQRVGARRPLGAVLNAGLDLATGPYIAKVDDDDRYGPDHLGDQVLAVHHSGAELVGRRVHGVYDETTDRTLTPAPGGEERTEDHLPGGTLLAPADVVRQLRWRHVPRAVDTELVRAVHLAGGSVYSSHRYGYVRVRHGDHLYEPEVSWPGPGSPGFDPTLLEA